MLIKMETIEYAQKKSSIPLFNWMIDKESENCGRQIHVYILYVSVLSFCLKRIFDVERTRKKN